MVKFEKIHLFITASAFILVFDYFSLLNFLKRPLDLVIIPVKKEISVSANMLRNIGNTIWIYPQIAKVYQERNDFAKNKEDLEFKLRLLTAENAKLRTQLEAPFPSSFKFVPAYVISFSRFVEIDQGSDQMISAGQPVVDGGVLLGKVVDVTPKRSKVLPVSDPDFSISGITSRGTRALVTGQAGQAVILSKVLQKDPLFLDDQVTTAGDDKTPPNLLIGKIAFINTDETATYKQAKISPAVNIDSEKIVFVITSL